LRIGRRRGGGSSRIWLLVPIYIEYCSEARGVGGRWRITRREWDKKSGQREEDKEGRT